MRIICLAFMLLASLWVWGQQQDAANNPEPEPEDPAAQPIEISSPTLDAIQESIKAIAANTDPNNQPKPERYDREGESKTLSEFDLDAQDSMADSTYWMMWGTWAALGVSFLALVGLFINLYQTRKIVKQNRAWITAATRETLFDDIAATNFAEFHTSWTNTGGTPAIDVFMDFRIDTVDTSETDNIPIFKPSEYLRQIGPFGPGVKHRDYVELTKNDWQDLIKNKIRVFIYTYFSYRDIYSKENRITESVEEVFVRERTIKVTPNPSIPGEIQIKPQKGTYTRFVGKQQRAT